ncbi:MAG: hypothetical protein DHS20C08_15970 [Rhodomicrobium sp.]|nr:MAG: hypothetical protein DHS20C08_15970 [Rhodomicrobium sp.]
MTIGKSTHMAALVGGAAYLLLVSPAYAGIATPAPYAKYLAPAVAAHNAIDIQWAVPDSADPQYPDASTEKKDEAAEATDTEASEDNGDTDDGVAIEDGVEKDDNPSRDDASSDDADDEAKETDADSADDQDKTAEDDSAVDTDGEDGQDDAATALEEAKKESPVETADPKTVDGCQKLISGMLTGNPIEFLSGRFTMSNTGRDKVGQIADFLKGCPDAKAVVNGHTDSDGTEAANQRLSGQRAEQVMELLIKLGIDKKRLRAVGHGQSQPLVENDTPENKALNRRIELDLY